MGLVGVGGEVGARVWGVGCVRERVEGVVGVWWW